LKRQLSLDRTSKCSTDRPPSSSYEKAEQQVQHGKRQRSRKSRFEGRHGKARPKLAREQENHRIDDREEEPE
jgi:hypothetical protein